MLQIVFSALSAAEISQLDTLDQLELLEEFQVSEKDLQDLEEKGDESRFGKLERDGKVLYRFRAEDWRLYFSVEEDHVRVHRVLHKNSLSDFFYRAKLPLGEDAALAESRHFWTLIDEGRQSGTHTPD